MLSLQEAALDQIISTCPDDILLKCYDRIVEKLKSTTTTVILYIDPTMGKLYCDNDLQSKKLFIKFIIKLMDDIDLIEDDDGIMLHLIASIDEIKNITRSEIESMKTYKELLQHLLYRFEIDDADDSINNYIHCVERTITIYFRRVFNRFESQQMTQLLNDFMFDHEVDLSKIFVYQSVKIFEQILYAKMEPNDDFIMYIMHHDGTTHSDFDYRLYQIK